MQRVEILLLIVVGIASGTEHDTLLIPEWDRQHEDALWLMPFVHNHELVLDVGAGRGRRALTLAQERRRRGGSAPIVAIEWNSTLFAFLSANVALEQVAGVLPTWAKPPCPCPPCNTSTMASVPVWSWEELFAVKPLGLVILDSSRCSPDPSMISEIVMQPSQPAVAMIPSCDSVTIHHPFPINLSRYQCFTGHGAADRPSILCLPPYRIPSSAPGTFFELPFFHTAEEAPSEEDITAILHLSCERLPRLVRFASSWGGPFCVTLYIRNATHDIPAVEEVLVTCTELKRRGDFHIVFADEGPYPPNVMRNRGQERCRTRRALFLDMDLVPSHGLHERLRQHAMAREENEKTVLVVPTWEIRRSGLLFSAETDSEDYVPRNKAEMRALYQHNQAQPMHMWFPLGHGPEDHAQWLDAFSPYEVRYAPFWEPYGVVSLDGLPRFDERFRGRGMDRNSHCFELFVGGYHFIVLPDVFLVHVHQGARKKSKEYLQAEKRNKKLFLTGFLHDVRQRYNSTATLGWPETEEELLEA